MEPGGSLPHSQEPATCPYRKHRYVLYKAYKIYTRSWTTEPCNWYFLPVRQKLITGDKGSHAM
jgi:hypothetical protein